MSEQAHTPDVVIIGGGLAGLTAALHLAEKGLHPLILEADPTHIGGRVAGGDTVEIDSWQFRAEHGVHGIWSPYRNLQAMLARHLIRPRFVPAQEESWVYRQNGKVRQAEVGTAIRYSPLPAPLHYINLFTRPRFLRMLDIRDWFSLPLVWSGLMWGVGVDPWAENQPLGDMTLGKLVKNWSPAVRAFFIGLARNGLSTSPEDVPLSGFVAFLRFYTLLRRDSWIFSYLPSDGGTNLTEPIAKKILALGGQIHMGAEVENIQKDASSWKIGYTQDNNQQTICATQIVLAMDAPNTQKLIENSPDLAVPRPLFWPEGYANAVIRVWYDTSPNSGAEGGIFTGDFTIHNFFWLHRINNQYRKWHNQTGGSAIEVHIYGPPKVLEDPDTALISKATADIQAAFPELRGHRIHQTLQRNPATHTLPAVGPQEEHLGIQTPWPEIYACGDWVHDTTPAFFLERAVVTGMLAANQILETRGLSPWPLIEHPAPERFVGWIEKQMKKGRRRKRQRLLGK